MFHEPGQLSLRLSLAASGVLASMAQHALLARHTRVFELSSREPSPLWATGAIAAVVSVVVSAALLLLMEAPRL